MIKLAKKSKPWRVALLSIVLCVLVSSQIYLEVFIYPHLT